MNNKCKYCDKPLVKIGYKRKNGKQHMDWEGRELHKKCLLIVEQQKRILATIARYVN